MVRPGSKRAYATLLTRPSYLPGVLILAHTLLRHQTAHPLLVLTTPSLPTSCHRALELESARTPLLRIVPVEPLLPGAHHEITLIAARFEDTWSKLRVFELAHWDAIVFLDADIMLRRNMDEVFDLDLPGPDWLAANHACVCNLDGDGWAPADWRAENCAYTSLRHPAALTAPTPVPHSSRLAPPATATAAEESDSAAVATVVAVASAKATHTLLNSGFFLFHPSASLWASMIHTFNTSPLLGTYQFPDQDFLADFFRDRWVSTGWQYNALKTMRYWHEKVWRDDEVRALHYIVDKPWSRRVASDGVAGHLGRDGVTHGWWWGVWEGWRAERDGLGKGGEELLRLVEDLVAPPLDAGADRRQREENRSQGWPVLVPDHPGMVRDRALEGVEL
ncbi:hypothetical protein MMC19_005556 [Ptychographa xylographoides]|nr:hypothetical protein [Ptychographa xylographoides]